MKFAPYTTNLGWNNYLGVSILVHGQSLPLDGRVAEINIEGVSVLFPSGEPPRIHAGDPVTLRLEASWLPRAVVTTASMTGKMKTDSGHLFRFGFSSQQSVQGQITPVLHSIFNRRIAPRVVPNPEDGIQVAFKGADAQCIALLPLAQISSTGLACLVEGDASDFPAVGEKLEVSFMLPGRRDELVFPCILRTRRTQGGQTVVGVEFDRDGTPEFSRQQGAVLGFVLARAPVPSFMG